MHAYKQVVAHSHYGNRSRYMGVSRPPNTAVFTSVYVLRDRKTITYVSHEKEDGAWQFHTDDVIEQYEDIAQIVALSEIVEIDPTILNLSSLPLGYYATRKDLNDPWTVSKQDV